jgi:hypothetical protein
MDQARALEELGVTGSWDDRGLRRAYLRKVKQHPPERDPEGFARVRAAYEFMRSLAVSSQTDTIESRSLPPPVVEPFPPPAEPNNSIVPEPPPTSLVAIPEPSLAVAITDPHQVLVDALHQYADGQPEEAARLLDAFEAEVSREQDIEFRTLPAQAVSLLALVSDLRRVQPWLDESFHAALARSIASGSTRELERDWLVARCQLTRREHERLQQEAPRLSGLASRFVVVGPSHPGRSGTLVGLAITAIFLALVRGIATQVTSEPSPSTTAVHADEVAPTSVPTDPPVQTTTKLPLGLSDVVRERGYFKLAVQIEELWKAASGERCSQVEALTPAFLATAEVTIMAAPDLAEPVALFMERTREHCQSTPDTEKPP